MIDPKEKSQNQTHSEREKEAAEDLNDVAV